MEKPEIPAGKLNSSRNSIWESFRKYGLWFRAKQIFLLFLVCSADLDNHLWRVVPPPSQILQFYVDTQDFHPGGLSKW